MRRTKGNAVARVSIKALESFREVMRTGSVTAAARRLRLTQPAVSRHLAQVETDLGLELFYRERGRLTPSPDALRLYEEADLALLSLDRVASLAEALRSFTEGHVRIVAPPSLVEGVIAAAVAAFLQDYPKLQITVDSRSIESAVDIVARRAADCGFAKLPLGHPNVAIRPLVTSGTVCALPAGHRLSKRRAIGPKDLANEPLILLGKGSEFRAAIRRAFDEARIGMNIRIETHAVGAACAFVQKGLGIAIVNELVAEPYLPFGIALVPFTPPITHEYGFMTSADVPVSKATEAFFDYCLTHIGKRPRRRRI